MASPSDILILLAAGSARRMQGVVADKTTAQLSGLPVFVHSLRAFTATGHIGRIILTYRDEEQLKLFQELVAKYCSEIKVDGWVKGGAERQDSFLAALETCAEHKGIVHIHDAARPLVTTEAILKVRAKALEVGAAILASRSADTVKIARAGEAAVDSSPERHLVWSAETPQVFKTALVLEAYRKVKESHRKVTDDSSAVSILGQNVALVENLDANLKLTRPADLALAEMILSSRTK